MNMLDKNLQLIWLLIILVYLVSCSEKESGGVGVDERIIPSNTSPATMPIEHHTPPAGSLQTPTSPPLTLLTQEIPVKPTSFPVQLTETPMATPTMPLDRNDLGAIYKKFSEAYGWSNVFFLLGQLHVEEGSQNTLTSYQAPHSPANSQLYAFSHYSDQIAYWSQVDPSEFWVSDVAYRNPYQIILDTEGVYVPRQALPTEHLQQLQWSPDDKHIITYMIPGTKPHLIYHLETNELEEWYWLCQDVIISPRTDQLAVLCTADNRLDFSPRDSYAIMEWGGSIWYTSERPDVVLSQVLPDETIPWRFSADGQQIAYFDPDDLGGHLLIADAHGNLSQFLPDSSLLQQDKRFTDLAVQYYQTWPEKDSGFFRWSHDGEQLLVYALGSPSYPCRLILDFETNELFEAPCWQVVEGATGRVLWTDLDSEETLFRDEVEKSSMRLVQAEFSPDGKMIAVSGQYFSDQLLAVIDLDTSVAYRLFPLPYAKIYWANMSH